jgi:hypothetical protein
MAKSPVERPGFFVLFVGFDFVGDFSFDVDHALFPIRDKRMTEFI